MEKTLTIDTSLADLKGHAIGDKIEVTIKGTVKGVEEREDWDVQLKEGEEESKRPKKGVVTVKYSELKFKNKDASSVKKESGMRDAYESAVEADTAE